MNTTNKLIIGTLIASTLFVAGVFADDSASGSTSTGTTNTGTTSTGITNTGVTSTGVVSDLKNEIEKNRAQIQSNWAQFHEDYGFIKQFLKLPATKVEAKTLALTLKTDLKAYHDSIKALIKEGQDSIKANTFDPAVFNVKASEIFTKHVETLSKYIDPAKMDAFKKFMDEKKAMILSNKELRKANFELKQEIKEIKKKFLSDKQREAIAKKLETRTINFYNKLIERIDAFNAKTKNETLKAQLNELKEMTQAKLDELNK